MKKHVKGETNKVTDEEMKAQFLKNVTELIT
jgi:hypothetical protein